VWIGEAKSGRGGAALRGQLDEAAAASRCAGAPRADGGSGGTAEPGHGTAQIGRVGGRAGAWGVMEQRAVGQSTQRKI
jgi:hypothetical protein